MYIKKTVYAITVFISLAASSLSLAYPLNMTPLPDEPNFPNVEKVVYRADMTIPEDARLPIISPDGSSRMGGLLARGVDGSRPFQPEPDTSLYNHAAGIDSGTSHNNSGYVGTSESLGLARQWVNDRLNHHGYVYYIASSPNFIPVNAVLRHRSPHPWELEYAAMQMVRYDQILGWRRSTSSGISSFIHNPAYNPSRFNRPTHPAQVDGLEDPLFRLAGFPANSPAWGESPWINAATCEHRSSCSPKQSSLHAAQDYMDKYTEEQRTQTRKKAAIFIRPYNFGLG